MSKWHRGKYMNIRDKQCAYSQLVLKIYYPEPYILRQFIYKILGVKNLSNVSAIHLSITNQAFEQSSI